MSELIRWIASEILVHETSVRRWLRRMPIVGNDEDDVVQEAYYRIAKLQDRSSIRSGRAYFFAVARNILLERLRRSRIVRIESVAEMDTLHIVDDGPSADRTVMAAQELKLVEDLINELPPRCREVFSLRKVEGLSQRATAERLKLTENVVEKEVARGLRVISSRLRELSGDEDEVLQTRQAR